MTFTGALNITKVFDNPTIWHVVGLAKIRNRTEILQVEGPHLSECIFKLENLMKGIGNGTQNLIQTANGSTSNKYIHSDSRIQSIYRYPYGNCEDTPIDNDNNSSIHKNQILEQEEQPKSKTSPNSGGGIYHQTAAELQEKAAKRGIQMTYSLK